MGIFKKKDAPQDGLIGVDIGAAGMKMVELAPEKGRLRLLTYGYSEWEDTAETHESFLQDPKRAAEVFTQIYKESGMKVRKANAALPSQSVFHAIITIPQPGTPKEDVKALIEAQVSKLLPRPIEEMIIDSTIIDKHLLPKALQEKGKKDKKKKSKEERVDVVEAVDSPEDIVPQKKHIRVLVSGAPRDLVQKYVELFKQAKVDLVSLETEAFALVRSLVGKDPSRVMVVDIGSSRTNITVVHEGIPYLHRSVQAGGDKVTAGIAARMGTSQSEAEQMKLDLALSESASEIPDFIQAALQPIVHEVRYSLDLYAEQEFHSNQSVEKIIVTGGSAHLPHLDEVFTKELDANIYIGNPWARIGRPEGVRPILDEVGPKLSVAIGLAMKQK